MKTYTYYSKFASNKEGYDSIFALSRKKAAIFFAGRKRLSLKDFLRLYEVSR